MIHTRRKFTSVIAALCALSMLLICCRSLFQPTRSNLTEVNSFSTGAYRMDIRVEVLEDDFAMRYDTSVLAAGDKARWEGTATVYYLDTYFIQDCTTLCDGSTSCKDWRGQWAESESKSPLTQIQNWQTLILQGEGNYQKKPVPAPTMDETDPADTAQCYRISLHEVPLVWESLCDANLDSLFGGNERLDVFESADVDLFYDIETLELIAVDISFEEDGRWLSASIAIESAEEFEDFSLTKYEFIDGLLHEEWKMMIQEQ